MPISDKQMQILAFPFTDFDALIADGAIRSGKTAFMTIAFIDDAMRRYNKQRFGICGKTVDSTVKNIIAPYLGLVYAKEKYNIQWRRTDKTLIISNSERENVFEIFGGKDESSFALIQGRTLAGVLFDEVALQPRSFVEQACARCSVDGSKMWFNCNPDSPKHWFYEEWICHTKRHNALRLHFELDDNPALSERIKNRYKSMYTGVFYDRYIRGMWVVADGLVYRNFNSLPCIVNDVPDYGEYFISVDYGTLNPFSAGLWCLSNGTATRIKEFYYNGRKKGKQKTDEEYYEDIKALADGRNINCIVVDPSAASFIECIRRHGDYIVQPANNKVIDGIRTVSNMLASGVIKIHKSCEDAIREFGLYRWDEKKSEDAVIKENDHAMDDIRYFCYTILRRELEYDEW